MILAAWNFPRSGAGILGVGACSPATVNPCGDSAFKTKQKFVIDSYEDEAVGHLEKNAEGKLAITRVELRPRIKWGDDRKPSPEELDKMHHASHENCFIANSVRTEVTVL